MTAYSTSPVSLDLRGLTMPFVPPPDVLLERYIKLMEKMAQAASLPDIKAVLSEAHDKLCALRKPKENHE